MTPLPEKIATAPKVQISCGDLIDKIVILEIKLQRLNSKEATENVCRELAALNNIANNILSERTDCDEMISSRNRSSMRSPF